MATKTKTKAKKVRSGSFDKAILAAAERIVDAYDIVMRREEGEWVGHAMEYPEAIGVGKTRVQVTAVPGDYCPYRGLAFFQAKFDISTVTLLAHPFLVSLVGLARADRLPGKHPLALFRHVLAAPFDDLNQVPAEG